MQIIEKKIKELTPYNNNTRTHSAEQVKQIVASIKEFGFTNPLLIDENNVIIAGHGRLAAAKKLKRESVPCIVLEGLTDAQKKAYSIADNKLALNAGWDEELLKIELQELSDADFDLELTGFSLAEIKPHLRSLETPDFKEGTIEDQGRLDELEPILVTCPYCEKEFDARKD